MPNTKSAEKRLRQNQERRGRNRQRKSVLRNQVKKVHEAVKRGDVERAEQEYVRAAHFLDRAAARNLIHRNAAARTKSRIQKSIRLAKGVGRGEEAASPPQE